MKKMRFGHIHTDFVSLDRAVDTIEELVRGGTGGYVVTPNVDHVVLAERSPLLRQAYASASLSLADGMPLVWASKLIGHPLPAKVSGSDLLGPVLARAAQRGMRVYFLGAAAGVGVQAARNAKKRFPGLQIVGVDSPPIGFDRDPIQDERAREMMLQTEPDIVVVALGCPKQETLMHRWTQNGATTVMLGLGASLDFLARRTRRAPSIISGIGLEWFYRLLHDPMRLARRYLVRDLRFVPILLRMWFHRRTELVYSVDCGVSRESVTPIGEGGET